MIAKLGDGKNFKGIVNYLLRSDKNAEILESYGVRDFTKEGMVQDFNFQCTLNTRVKAVVGHDSLNFPSNENLDNEKMIDIAKDFMKAMRIENTQYVIIKHNDREHQHMHILYNRVDNDGKNIRHDRQAINKAFETCRVIEQKYNLIKVETKERRFKRRPEKGTPEYDEYMKERKEKRMNKNKGLKIKIERYNELNIKHSTPENTKAQHINEENKKSPEHNQNYLVNEKLEKLNKLLVDVIQLEQKEQEKTTAVEIKQKTKVPTKDLTRDQTNDEEFQKNKDIER